MYIVCGIERKTGEFEGHSYDNLVLHTLTTRKGLDGQACSVFKFSLRKVPESTVNVLKSIKVGDKIGEIYYDQYRNPCGIIK